MRLGANSDMIMNLPDNVIDQILIHLPIRDAVKTSVLSTKWRYKWTTMTELVFHDLNLFRPYPHYTSYNETINFIDRVLLLHSGFIHKFELSSERLPIPSTFESFDCWILFLSRKNIKEFALKFQYVGGHLQEDEYNLPTCFFSAQQISTLELHRCALKPPPTFTGFSKLKSLCLHKTRFVDKCGFESLISKCPLLERLTCTMAFSDPHYHLNICSPNLKYLCLCGNTFKDMCFENTPLLSDVSITLWSSNLRTRTRKVINILSSLPNLRKFVVELYFLEFLSLGKIPEKLPFTCHHLTYLSINLSFEYVNGICVTLCLINSSPNLRELHITCREFSISCDDTKNFWKKRTLIDWNMSVLQIVNITDIEGFENELEFIKLLLANSPMLEMLIIKYNKLDFKNRKVRNVFESLEELDISDFENRNAFEFSEELDMSDFQNHNVFEFLKELDIFPRASPKAKIEVIEVKSVEEPDDFSF